MISQTLNGAIAIHRKLLSTRWPQFAEINTGLLQHVWTMCMVIEMSFVLARRWKVMRARSESYQ
ncbi:MAG: hypothetical protein Ct9H300mP28_25480 [Pseudomonadota bacterium]|nr:MAG: hypothetical protein Ct9H300mP28_25480 [Pseudomonadota bacterium]